MAKKIKPRYFENQKQAASLLSLDEHQLKQWKAEGCPAFKYGRIYHAELLEWIEAKHAMARKNVKPAGNANDGAKVQRGELPEQGRTIRDWKEDRARVEYERAQFALDVEKRKYVLLDEMCCAVGQMLAGFRTAINMLPGSAARWIVGLKDFHAIKAKLESEVDAVLQALGRCEYLEDRAPAVIDRVLNDQPQEYRAQVKKIVAQVFIELGHETLSDLMPGKFLGASDEIDALKSR